MTIRRVAVVCSALGMALTGAVFAPARATSYVSGNCTVSGFLGGLGVYYASYSSTYWKLDHTIYQLTPADSSSDKNNVSQSLYGGSSTAKLASTGSAHRDGARHTLWTVGSVNYIGKKGGSAYVSEHVIFDRFGSDPNCTTYAILP